MAFSATLGAETPLDCSPLPGGESPAVHDLLARHQVLLLGELHGTDQAPALVAALACRALDVHQQVLVGLEIPPTEQERVERFLASPGRAQDRAALLSGGFWQRSYQDGRSSQAMADLLDSLRVLSQTAKIRVLLFDQTPAQGSRDQAMAERLAALIPKPLEGVVLVLTGNYHARLAIGTRFDPDFVPMGLHLQRARDDLEVVALDLTYSGGTAWICQPAPAGCGVLETGGNAQEPGLELLPDLDNGFFNGSFDLGPISASPPAVDHEPR